MITLLDVWKIFCLSQAFFSIGTTVIFIYIYTRKTRDEYLGGNKLNPLSLSVIGFALSHVFLTLATCKTAFFNAYKWDDGWYWITTIAYLFADVAMVIIIKGVATIYYQNRIKNKHNGRSSISGEQGERTP